jgi:hypothetical protein
MKRGGGLFCFGDVVPAGYFTEAEIADLVARGKVLVELEQVPEAVELEQVPEAAELEQVPEAVELGSPKKKKGKKR